MLRLLLLVGLFLVGCTPARYIHHVSYQSVRMVDSEKQNLSSLSDIPPTATIATKTSIADNGDVEVVVYNLSDSTMAIDRAQSFVVTTHGQQIFYNPEITTHTTSQSAQRGASVNVGAVTGALGLSGPLQGILGGVNVGGGKGVGSSMTTYDIDQQIVYLAPNSHISMKGDINIGHLVSASALENNEYNILNIDPNTSGMRIEICIAYSLDRQRSYKTFQSSYYVNSWISIPVPCDGKYYYPNTALRQLYEISPKCLEEKSFIMYFGRNSDLPYDNLSAFYDYK